MKRLLCVLCIILCVVLLASCGPAVTKQSGNNDPETDTDVDTDTDTDTDDDKPVSGEYEIIPVDQQETSSDYYFWYLVGTKSGNGEELIPITDASVLSATITIVSESQETLCTATPEITSSTNGSYVCKLSKEGLDIKPSSTPNGNAVCVLTAGSSSCEAKLALNNLPLDSSFVKLPELPKTIGLFGSANTRQRDIIVKEIVTSVEAKYGKTRIKLKVSGETAALTDGAIAFAGITLKATYNGAEVYNKKYTKALDENGNFTDLEFEIELAELTGADLIISIEDYYLFG